MRRADLGQEREALSGAKASRRGLPAYACIKLAKLIGVEPISVIAASELVTEKKEERRAEWLPLLTDDWRARRDSNARPLPSEGSTLSS